MRVLVTGADGFVGKHLCRHLRENGDEVIEAHGPRGDSAHAPGLSVDVTALESVRACVAEARPDGVIHLAGFSSVAKSHQDPARAFAVNAQGSVNLLVALKESAPRARVVLVGSGEMYGAVPSGTRATEDTPLRPLSPYAAAKVAAEVAGLQFTRGYKLEVVSARPFNHLGPGQDPGFVVPAFAAQLARIGADQAEPVLKVGDLGPIRDFSHVRDVVAAYRLMLLRGEAGAAYNVCSGAGRSIRDLLDEMLRLSGVNARVEVDPARLRPAEIPSLVGDPARLIALGWEPRLGATDALREVLEEQRAALPA
jgi:GDP-4-dehydro-6-deoxy-D-mannose reductase